MLNLLLTVILYQRILKILISVLGKYEVGFIFISHQVLYMHLTCHCRLNSHMHSSRWVFVTCMCETFIHGFCYQSCEIHLKWSKFILNYQFFKKFPCNSINLVSWNVSYRYSQLCLNLADLKFWKSHTYLLFWVLGLTLNNLLGTWSLNQVFWLVNFWVRVQ